MISVAATSNLNASVPTGLQLPVCGLRVIKGFSDGQFQAQTRRAEHSGGGYASRLHMSFTFHQAAAQNLEQDWQANRLPSFDPTPANASAVVILRGLQRDEQVEELLKTWMEPARNEHAGPSPISPFTPDVPGVLRSVSQARAGILLNRASELLYAGAEAQVGEIDGAFAQQHFAGHGHLAAVAAADDAGADYDDLLA